MRAIRQLLTAWTLLRSRLAARIPYETDGNGHRSTPRHSPTRARATRRAARTAARNAHNCDINRILVASVNGVPDEQRHETLDGVSRAPGGDVTPLDKSQGHDGTARIN